jgi:hypothetical protein
MVERCPGGLADGLLSFDEPARALAVCMLERLARLCPVAGAAMLRAMLEDPTQVIGITPSGAPVRVAHDFAGRESSFDRAVGAVVEVLGLVQGISDGAYHINGVRLPGRSGTVSMGAATELRVLAHGAADNAVSAGVTPGATGAIALAWATVVLRNQFEEARARALGPMMRYIDAARAARAEGRPLAALRSMRDAVGYHEITAVRITQEMTACSSLPAMAAQARHQSGVAVRPARRGGAGSPSAGAGLRGVSFAEGGAPQGGGGEGSPGLATLHRLTPVMSAVGPATSRLPPVPAGTSDFNIRSLADSTKARLCTVFGCTKEQLSDYSVLRGLRTGWCLLDLIATCSRMATTCKHIHFSSPGQKQEALAGMALL